MIDEDAGPVMLPPLPDLEIWIPLSGDGINELLIALDFYWNHLERQRQQIPYPQDQEYIRRASLIADIAEWVRMAKKARTP